MSENKTQMMIQAAVAARIPLMLVGSPGTGKTETVRQMAREMDYELITILGSQMDATDLAGLPKGENLGLSDDGEEIWGTVNLSPWWQVRVIQKKRVILFLDEFSNTAPSVRASMLTMLQNREFPNGHRFPEETVVIGAMNASEEAADGYELDLPTKNRIFFISWNPPVDEWIAGMRAAWGKEVSEDEQKWKNKIASFINDNRTFLHVSPTDSPTTEVYGLNPNDPNDMEVFRSAWPSRRSWDNLSAILANAPDEIWVQDTIAQGTVGYSAAHAFRDWLRQNEDSVVTPQEALDNPEDVDWAGMSVNDGNMLLRGITELVDADTSEAVLDLLVVVAESGVPALAGPFFQEILQRLTSNNIPAKKRQENITRLRSVIPLYKDISKES